MILPYLPKTPLYLPVILPYLPAILSYSPAILPYLKVIPFTSCYPSLPPCDIPQPTCVPPLPLSDPPYLPVIYPPSCDPTLSNEILPYLPVILPLPMCDPCICLILVLTSAHPPPPLPPARLSPVPRCPRRVKLAVCKATARARGSHTARASWPSSPLHSTISSRTQQIEMYRCKVAKNSI